MWLKRTQNRPKRQKVSSIKSRREIKDYSQTRSRKRKKFLWMKAHGITIEGKDELCLNMLATLKTLPTVRQPRNSNWKICSHKSKKRRLNIRWAPAHTASESKFSCTNCPVSIPFAPIVAKIWLKLQSCTKRSLGQNKIDQTMICWIRLKCKPQIRRLNGIWPALMTPNSTK